MEGEIDDQQAAEIIIAEELDSIRFRRDFVARNRPVLLRRGAGGWPALRNWSHAELTRRCGEARVNLEFSSSGLFDPNTNTGRAAVEFCETTLAEALPILARAHKSGAYYIRETPLAGVTFRGKRTRFGWVINVRNPLMAAFSRPKRRQRSALIPAYQHRAPRRHRFQR